MSLDSPPAPAGSKSARTAVYLLLLVFFLLRYDLWAFDDAHFVLGLPLGLTYHLLYCLLSIGVLGLLVRFAWPSELEEAVAEEQAADVTGGNAP